METASLELSGRARGHEIFLKKSVHADGENHIDKYSGKIDGIDLDQHAAQQLFNRYEPLGDWEMSNAADKAIKAQQEFSGAKEKPGAEQAHSNADVIEELLRDEPENS